LPRRVVADSEGLKEAFRVALEAIETDDEVLSRDTEETSLGLLFEFASGTPDLLSIRHSFSLLTLILSSIGPHF